MVSSFSSSSSSSNKRSKKPKRNKSSSPDRRQAPTSSSTSSSSSEKTPNNPPPPFPYPPPPSVSSSSTVQSLVMLVGPASSCSSAPAALTTTRTTAESVVIAGSACSAESRWRPRKRRGTDKREKVQVDAGMGRDPKCIVCGKQFSSWRAYFGHLRTHPERQWRWAFPPPELTAEERRLFEQELAPTLLGIAADVKARMNLDGGAPAARRLSFDLNRSPPPEEEDAAMEEEEDNNNNDGENGDGN